MAFKILVLAALVAAVQGGLVAPVTSPVLAAKVVDAEYDPNPQYTFAYDVQDSLTGDSKNQFETRNGDIVQGRYSLIEPDGNRRIVDYTADPINGFNAVVQREPVTVAKYVASAPVAVPAVARFAAPVAKVVAAPVAGPTFAKFAAPVALPPVAKVAAPLVAAQYASAPLSYPAAARVAAPLVASAPFAKLAYPAPLAYSAPIASPYARVVSPFGYSAAYTTFL